MVPLIFLIFFFKINCSLSASQNTLTEEEVSCVSLCSPLSCYFQVLPGRQKSVLVSVSAQRQKRSYWNGIWTCRSTFFFLNFSLRFDELAAVGSFLLPLCASDLY